MFVIAFIDLNYSNHDYYNHMVFINYLREPVCLLRVQKLSNFSLKHLILKKILESVKNKLYLL